MYLHANEKSVVPLTIGASSTNWGFIFGSPVCRIWFMFLGRGTTEEGRDDINPRLSFA